MASASMLAGGESPGKRGGEFESTPKTLSGLLAGRDQSHAHLHGVGRLAPAQHVQHGVRLLHPGVQGVRWRGHNRSQAFASAKARGHRCSSGHAACLGGAHTQRISPPNRCAPPQRISPTCICVAQEVAGLQEDAAGHPLMPAGDDGHQRLGCTRPGIQGSCRHLQHIFPFQFPFHKGRKPSHCRSWTMARCHQLPDLGWALSEPPHAPRE